MVVTITKPTIGGSEDSWGLTINTALDDIVDGLNGVTTVAPNLTEGSWQVGGVAVGSTAAELNILDGVTASTAEINVLDGVTASAAEINVLDGVTASTAEINVLNGVTASAAEINVLDGVTASAAEINVLDGVTASTAQINVLNGVTVSTAEINYLVGVTSPIQTQINNLVAGTSGGTVTSVGLSVPTGLSVSGSPVTSSGTLSISFSSGYSLLTSAQATSISNIPTNTSQLTNDSGFVTNANVSVPDTLGESQSYASITLTTNTWYQNTTGRAIAIYYQLNTGGGTAYVSTTASGGVQVGGPDGDSGTWDNGYFIVPNLHYYKTDGSSNRAASRLS